MVCGKCGYDCCFVAKHINEGTRKYWIKKEESLANWRYDKKFTVMMKNATPDDTQLVKFFIKSVKEIFTAFVENKNNLDDYFPKYVRDYKRTTGRRETGWKTKGSKSVLKQKQSSLRGAIYEGAMVKFCENHDYFDPILVPIPYYDKQENIHTDYEPDFWFNFGGKQIPIEFKTFGKQNMEKSKFKVPTIIFHCTNDARVPISEGKFLAANIENSKFVPIQSKNHILLETDEGWNLFKKEMDNFLEK